MQRVARMIAAMRCRASLMVTAIGPSWWASSCAVVAGCGWSSRVARTVSPNETMVRVVCRCQPVQDRVWYWSSPNWSLLTWNDSSIAHLRPATATRAAREAGVACQAR